MKLIASLTLQKLLVRPACLAAAACVGLMSVTCSADVSFLVDFTGVDNGAGPSGGAVPTVADFAINDSAIDPATPINVFNSDTAIPGTQAFGVAFVIPEFTISGIDSGATPGPITSSVSLSTVNGSFNANALAPFGSNNFPASGDPILNDYIFANGNSNFSTTVDSSAIVPGSIVTLVAYSHGDRLDQVADLILDVGGTTTRSPVTSLAQPFHTFTFTQPVGVTSFDLTVDNAGEGSVFAVLNGFSITSVEPAAVPEPSSLQMLAFLLFGAVARRRKR